MLSTGSGRRARPATRSMYAANGLPTCSNGAPRQSRMRLISCSRPDTRTSFCGKQVDCLIHWADLIRSRVSVVREVIASGFCICVSLCDGHYCSTAASQQLSSDWLCWRTPEGCSQVRPCPLGILSAARGRKYFFTRSSVYCHPGRSGNMHRHPLKGDLDAEQKSNGCCRATRSAAL
ncbi:hypothetical protein X989_5107 [Burkholderia pseudomallei MSHR4378]|nr:hypothetical protein X989_5107 [Burkholderia pseudomallei MSHR4378]